MPSPKMNVVRDLQRVFYLRSAQKDSSHGHLLFRRVPRSDNWNQDSTGLSLLLQTHGDRFNGNRPNLSDFLTRKLSSIEQVVNVFCRAAELPSRFPNSDGCDRFHMFSRFVFYLVLC